MEEHSKKRKLQSGPAAESRKPEKRTKTGGKPPATKAKAKKGKGKGKATGGFRRLDAAALPWMDAPDGMMGLEVIEGVDIVRDGDKVQFLVPEELAAVAAASENKEQEEEEDFMGFDDLPAVNNSDEIPELEVTSDEAAGEEEEEEEEEEDDDDDDEDEETEAAEAEDDDVLSEDEASRTDVSAWEPLGLSPAMLSALSTLKFSKPTLIQSSSIPEVLAGHDVIGKASTGSGKTLAFAIPIIEQWLQARSEMAEAKETAEEEENSEEEPEETEKEKLGEKIPTALILSPTRELAKQLTDHIRALCAGLASSPYVCSVTGGLSILKQQRQLAKADIIIATPGRLWEVISADIPLLKAFKQIKFLVVDEADRLLSEGNFKEAENIIKALDREEMGFEAGQGEDEEDEDEEMAPRQTLVFSATFNKTLQQKLAGKGKPKLMSEVQSMEYLLKKLNFREEKPKFIDVNPVSQMAEKLKEGLVECGGLEKDLFLYAILMLRPAQKTLVFTNSISTVKRLTPMLLNLQLNIHPLHSQMPQKARLRSIERFTSAKPNASTVLVSTDVAARGLDIPNVDQVIHYHVPRTADGYVHRSGRTARANKSGVSILLCAPEEVTPTRRLVSKVHLEDEDSKKHFIRTIDIDRRVVSKLKPRLTLAKQIADAMIAKSRGAKEDNWMKTAADELGVELDSDEMEKAMVYSGKGSGKKQKEREVAKLTKAQVGMLRAQLRELLERKVNTGVSEKFIAGGRVDMEALLRGEGGDHFLGQVDSFFD